MFDRNAAALEIIAALTDNDINSISELRLRMPHYGEFASELRDNLPTAYQPDDDGDDDKAAHDPTDAASDIVAAIVPDDGGEVLRYFNHIDAAFEWPVSDVSFDPDKDVHAFLISVLEAVYEHAVGELIRHVEELVDEAEQEANEAEFDAADDETSDEGKD